MLRDLLIVACILAWYACATTGAFVLSYAWSWHWWVQ